MLHFTVQLRVPVRERGSRSDLAYQIKAVSALVLTVPGHVGFHRSGLNRARTPFRLARSSMLSVHTDRTISVVQYEDEDRVVD